MKPAILLKAIISVLLFSSVTMAMAQTSRPFKGEWCGGGLYVKIDFYGKTIPDPNSMDEYPCAGIIKIKHEINSMSYTIENIKVNGNRATATAYFAEKDSHLTFEYLSDGSLRLTSSDGFAYVDDSLKKLPKSSYVLHNVLHSGECGTCKNVGATAR